jgi:hypothetical protein
MTEDQVLEYVKASAIAQGLVLDEARTRRVAMHLARTAHLAQLLEQTPMSVEDELAEIFKPSAFKTPGQTGL